ncbi:MAG: molybdopterin cofactor-binding domain-containing protein [Pseudomonadota bacterium]
MSRLGKITRRTLLLGSGIVAGGVVFGYWQYKRPHKNPLLDQLKAGEAALTPYVHLGAEGITVIAPRAEMGQGVHTTLAAMVAEELDVDLDQVTVVHGPASKAYFNAVVLEEAVPYAPTDTSPAAERARHFMRVPAKFLSMQITGGSTSVPDGFEKMRIAGAAAREVLVAAAAEQLGLEKRDLVTQSGEVLAPDGRRIRYAALAERAARIPLPEDPKLKAPSEWRLLGRSQARVDIPAKSTGRAEYAIDTRLPGMRFATVRRNPNLGAKMRSYNADTAETMPGVDAVVPLTDGVAVVADNTWRAIQAAKTLSFEWEAASYPPSSDEILQQTRGAFGARSQDSQFRDDGDVDSALAEADVIEAEYRVPLLAHATMEPMNATAWLRPDRLDVWAGNQNPTQALKDAADLSGLPRDQVFIHTPYMGGGFGRRNEMDFVRQAVEIACALPGTPINLTWSREEDMTHDQYRPAAVARFRGSVSGNSVDAFDLKLAADSVMASQLGRIGLPAMGSDGTIVQAAWDQPYDIPNYRVTGYRAEPMLPLTYWRSVGGSQNGFFHESMLDELAYAAGRDPLDLRLDLVFDPVSRAVLEAVGDLSGWGQSLPTGHARGIAFVMSFGVPVAQVIEVAHSDRGVRLVNAYIAADVGVALDPSNIEAQLQGGLVFGLSAAMMGEISVEDGKVVQSNFHDFPVMRFHQSPVIKTVVLENGARIRGIGEPGVPPAAPALANALFALTGERYRTLPLNQHVRFA